MVQRNGRKQDAFVGFRVAGAYLQLIDAAARQAGLTRSTFIRHSTLLAAGQQLAKGGGVVHTGSPGERLAAELSEVGSGSAARV